MASASAVRRKVAEVSRRLLALLEESVAPAKAVQILVAERILSVQSSGEAALPLSSAIKSVMPSPLRAISAAGVGDYVSACESQGRADAALRLLGRLKIKRASGRTSLAAIAVEFILLIFVLLIHSIFVLPQFKAMFDAAGTPMPKFTQLVFGLIGPSGPFIWAVVLVLFVVFIWRMLPVMFGPLIRPIDGFVLALPLIGPAIRQSNSDRIAGWLGFAAADAASQRLAVEAAKTWFRGDMLARECDQILRAAGAGGELQACLAQARGFDSEFRADVSLADRADSLAALRARWRIAETLPEQHAALEPALAQVALGVIVAMIVIALYLPIFKLGALM